MKYNNKDSEVKKIETYQTGGDVMNDIVYLKNGQVLVISGDVVCLYKDYDSYEENLEDSDMGSIYRL